ncbi:uncharacterized protein METZ01_LOCUS473185 [marine metagenome]|uniref:Outer membrane protein beta-barrel domain-containing protein n=1 Tax=marine metagenome TaxID=408172 RepID=A0A383BKH1_9ZZZZ
MNLFSLLLVSGLFANSFLVINGSTYHHNVTDYDYCDNDCNSNNWGIGYETYDYKRKLVYSGGTFMDSWNKFSWYIGMGREYEIINIVNWGFSLGIMNKNYDSDKQITTLYMFPYLVLFIADKMAINMAVIPSSRIAKGWTGGNEWPTTLFFQYKIRLNR